jgi:hypothetical protein
MSQELRNEPLLDRKLARSIPFRLIRVFCVVGFFLCSIDCTMALIGDTARTEAAISQEITHVRPRIEGERNTVCLCRRDHD